MRIPHVVVAAAGLSLGLLQMLRRWRGGSSLQPCFLLNGASRARTAPLFSGPEKPLRHTGTHAADGMLGGKTVADKYCAVVLRP
ncbi:hypothetical protein C7E17_09500 [Stenotrophomonas maltophilia]|nr:hypothetical protein C7E17_09500 [Stenotrophomonas maltophilia]